MLPTDPNLFLHCCELDYSRNKPAFPLFHRDGPPVIYNNDAERGIVRDSVKLVLIVKSAILRCSDAAGSVEEWKCTVP